MAPKCKLTYFAIKGLAEPIRYLLSFRNIEFEDLRYDIKTFKASIKQSKYTNYCL